MPVIRHLTGTGENHVSDGGECVIEKCVDQNGATTFYLNIDGKPIQDYKTLRGAKMAALHLAGVPYPHWKREDVDTP